MIKFVLILAFIKYITFVNHNIRNANNIRSVLKEKLISVSSITEELGASQSY